MTKDEYLIKLANHLMQQTERSEARVTYPGGQSGPICAYAGDNGNGCAIGFLLPREVGKALDESGLASNAWSSVTRLAASDDTSKAAEAARAAVAIFAGLPTGMLTDAQVIHDNSRNRAPKTKARMLRELDRLASNYGALLALAHIHNHPLYETSDGTSI